MLYTILIVLLILVVLGLPNSPYPIAHPFGYYPSGILGAVLVIILVLFLLGRL